VCLIIRQDGIRGEAFSYCFNRSWRNNQVTPSHSTNFSTDFLEQTVGIANGDKGTGAEGRDVGQVIACISGLPASLAASATDCYLHVTTQSIGIIKMVERSSRAGGYGQQWIR